MKIGYPCLNYSLDCRANKTFRLKSFSQSRLIETVENNLNCLDQILRYNVENRMLFFRITSDLVPFASHPVCTFNWQKHFAEKFKQLGKFIKQNRIRISMHPDQFTLINSTDPEIFQRSHNELRYHADVLDSMQLDHTARIQIHVGGVYGDKPASMKRFIKRFEMLDEPVTNRLVIENDERQYCLADCLKIHKQTAIPVLFDVYHHTILNKDEPLKTAIEQAASTWRESDGIPTLDYSSQAPGKRTGSHTDSIDPEDFQTFLRESRPFDFDIMLEIKDKQKSAAKAVKIAKKDKRFITSD